MKYKRTAAVLPLAFLVLFCKTPIIAQDNGRIAKVCIDAGHGGKDPGAVGAISYEKTAALKIALKLGGYIKSAFPDVQVIYTRDKDVFIPLNERAEIANNAKADLFISIHLNATASPKKDAISGTEIYVMGTHVLAENLEVAKRENDVIVLEDNYLKSYDGYDPNSPQSHIMMSMYQNAYLTQSLELAEYANKYFKSHAKRHSRGIHQAGFLVLRKTSMPSILVESGYISNKSEEAYLATSNGQNKIAMSLFMAFRDYKSSVEKKIYNTQWPTELDEEEEKEVDSLKTEILKSTIPIKKPAIAIKEPVKSLPQATPVSVASAPTKALAYRIQLLSSTKPLEKTDVRFSKIKNWEREKLADNTFRYYESCKSKEAAEKLLPTLLKDFPNAKIVARQ